ncbi:MAG: terminase large subunit domain-containing protein [Janthinobacterium lividum]
MVAEAVTPHAVSRAHDAAPNMMRASPVYFATKVMGGPKEAPYNGRFLAAPHHLQWDKMVTQDVAVPGQNGTRCCVLASRGLGKTFFFSEAYPIWRAIYHPGKVTFILSATKSQAEEVLDHIKKQVEENPELQWLVPQRKGLTWNKSQIKFSNGSRIVTAGFGTRKRGLHPDCIIVDDGLTDESLYSPTVRRKAIKYFYSAITNMLNPGGIIIVVGTPFHKMDLYGTLKVNPAYTYRVFPAIVNGIPVFPKRFSYDFLMAKKREIGAIIFAQEIECKPISDEASLFPQQLFQGDGVECMGLKLGMPYEFWRDAGVSLFMGVDFALSAQTGADYTVIFVMGVDDAGNRYWVDIIREHGLAYKSQLSLINTVARKYEVQLAVLEANQAQRIFGDDLINKTDLPIKKYNTGVEKHSLSKGIPGLRILMENKKMRIPRGDKHSVDMTDIVIEELGGFTYVDGKLESVGEHDDTAMACWLANIAVKSGGFRASFGDEEVKQALQASRDTLRAADVPDDTLNLDPADIIDAYDGDVEYDMFGNPVPRDGEIIGADEGL